VTVARGALGVAFLLLGTSLVAYCALVDVLGGTPQETTRLWTRPVLLIPLALTLIFLGGWLLRPP
jgi:hypothetical protein